MRFLLQPLLLLSLPILISAQTCLQYAPTSGSECDCPPGFAGTDCSLPVCGASLFAGTGSGRALAPSNGSVENCACDDGWGGSGCTVCATDFACGSAYNASDYTSQTSSSLLSAGQVANQTMICNASPRVYTAGQMSCDVITPLLQTLFPLSSKLTISRNIDTSLSPIPGVTSPGENSTVYAQLWYDNAETFFCKANSCNQTLIAQDSGNSSTWTCQNLECTCMPGTAFCSGMTDLTKTINSLTGELVIQCDATGGTCAFKQTLLVNTFGTSGLALSACSFGECISQNNVDYLSGTVALAVVSGSDLSSGVIAGLCVVGAIIFFALLGLVWGYIAQKKARNSIEGRDDKRPGVGVDWSGVGYEIRLAGNGMGLERLGLGSKKEKTGAEVEDGLAGTSKGGWKTILAGGEGRVEPGKLVAILGPSGAGKSTLVDLLACRRKTGRTTGKVTFFTTSREKEGGGRGAGNFRPRVGYVDQSDVHSPTSTVREALLLAARLRLPEYMPVEEKQARVEEVLSQLGLMHIADSPIGDNTRRGISGGEVRRVSIGLELVAKPHILLLDEPTSGLDSVSAAKVVSVLRDLAHDFENPTTVIASIHQPSSKLYFSFDSVIVLAQGKQVYNGNGGHSPVDHFVSRGGPALPLGYNVADYLLEIASEGNPELLPSSSSMTTFNNPPTSRRSFLQRTADSNLEKSTFPSSPTSDDDNEIAIHTLHRNDTPSSHNNNSLTQRSSQSDDIIPTNYKPTLKPVSSFLTQFQILCGREWRTIRRDKSLVLAHTIVAIVAGVGSGGLYYQVDLTISGFQNRIGTLFFLGALIAFSSLSALYNLITIRPLFLRERSASYYSPSAWLLARCLFDIIPLRLIPTIILSTITYWMAGLQPKASNYFKFELILILYALGMTLFNFLIAVVISGAGTAILFCSIYNLYLLVYAGFFINLNKIPPVLRWLRYFDTLGYCLEALSVNEVNSGLQIVDELSGVPVVANATLIMSMLFGFGGNNYYRDVIVLFIFFLGYLILTVLGVILVMKERR
ncbi:hypothetical protein BDY24DRAFT_355976 [Mrakia frigida]|uniref:uncharacterized protein n=1 Tax=Mrakia frigida TaxID=29902 RepID=UPI003FCC11FD